MNWDDVLNVKLDMQITAIGFNGEGNEECYESAEGEASPALRTLKFENAY